jgi:putative methyltransferase
MLSAGLKNQLFIYLCQVFPNTEMADPEYQKRFGIVTKRIVLTEIHGAIRTPDLVTEYEDVIVTTDSMPLQMWREMVLFSWLTMVMHSLKVAFFVTLYLTHQHQKPFTDFITFLMSYGSRYPLMARELREFNSQIDRLLEGGGRGRVVSGYAPIYWDEEEASFLRVSECADAFYAELLDVTRDFLNCNDIAHREAELIEVMRYQRLRIPTANDEPLRVHVFSRNIPEYFDRLLTSHTVALREGEQTMTIYSRQFPDKGRFAVETLMWGRKSGTIMTKVEWTERERIAA